LAEVARLVKQASGEEAEPSHVSVKLAHGEGELVFDAVADFADFARTNGTKLALARTVCSRIGHQIGAVGVTLKFRRYWFLGECRVGHRGGPQPGCGKRLVPEVSAVLRTAGQPVSSWVIYLGGGTFGCSWSSLRFRCPARPPDRCRTPGRRACW